MKKFATKAVVLAVGAACGGSVLAGSIVSPASNAAATKYAVEALTPTTTVAMPALQYQMGVSRTVAQDFTVIITPSAGSTFTAGACLASVPTLVGGTGGAGAALTASVKRQSNVECAYEVDVQAPLPPASMDTTAVLNFAPFSLATQPLATAGSSVVLTVNLWDLGETARIDNLGPLQRTMATSVQAVNIYAAFSDAGTPTTDTAADVNAPGGPLTGFLVAGDDTVGTARADSVYFDNNSIGAKLPDGVTDFDFRSTTGTASMTLNGSTSGLEPGLFCVDTDGDGTECETGEKMTTTTSSGTLSGIASDKFPTVGNAEMRTVSFTADGTTQLGTSRTFGLTGSIAPQAWASLPTKTEPLKDKGYNSTTWVWSANASQLMSPYMSTNALYVTRFSMLNLGALDVGYSVQCFTEGAGTATNGANGTLKGNGTTVLNASDVCTFSDPTKPRGAVLFTINAPIESVKGVYNIVDAVTGANGFVPLTRPYKQQKTTE